jgi:hypothetical protein
VELGKIEDKVIIGGPGNSLFKRGRGDMKGFCPERTVKVERKVVVVVVKFFISIFITVVCNFHNTFIYILISGIYYEYF